jgi:hypothetical protein
MYFVEIRNYWLCHESKGVLLTVVPTVFDPLFCRLFRLDGIYINKDATKYSIKPIKTMNVDKNGEVVTDQYMKYHEGIAHKFPGY